MFVICGRWEFNHKFICLGINLITAAIVSIFNVVLDVIHVTDNSNLLFIWCIDIKVNELARSAASRADAETRYPPTLAVLPG